MKIIEDVESPSAYIPLDRRHALAAGVTLAERVRGAALFADISALPLDQAIEFALRCTEC